MLELHQNVCVCTDLLVLGIGSTWLMFKGNNPWIRFIPFGVDHLPEGRKNNFDTVAFTESVFHTP